MIIMGIDCGYTHPGCAIVDFDNTSADQPILDFKHGETLETERREDRVSVILDDHRRISMISKWLRETHDRFRPSLVVLELPTSGARSALAIKGMGFATALTIATVESYFKHDKLELISPYDSKLWCCGDRHAEKDEVIKAVSKFFPNVPWPTMKRKKGINSALAEGIADSLAAILYIVKCGKAASKEVEVQ